MVEVVKVLVMTSMSSRRELLEAASNAGTLPQTVAEL